MLNIDICNGEKPNKNILGATANFNDLTATYWGYIYRLDNGKIIGDYTADSSEEITKAFRVAWKS
jgi:hypothetical protein